jgi:hypothetical protein
VLLLNASGKNKIAKLMSENISPLPVNRKEHPITLKRSPPSRMLALSIIFLKFRTMILW